MSDTANWRIVQQFSGPPGTETDALAFVDNWARRRELAIDRLEMPSTARAILLHVGSLRTLSTGEKDAVSFDRTISHDPEALSKSSLVHVLNPAHHRVA